MDKVSKFEELIVWQKSRICAVHIYKLFTPLKDYEFKNQICGAALSISNNIAEGFERSSNADFSRFLYIAKGSCGEVRSMVYIALDLGYITKEDFNITYTMVEEISKMLGGFIKALKPS